MIYLICVKAVYEHTSKHFLFEEKKEKFKVISNVKPIYAHSLNEAMEKYRNRMGDNVNVNLSTMFETDLDSFSGTMNLISDKKHTTLVSATVVELAKENYVYGIRYLVDNLQAEDFKAWWVENNPQTDSFSNFPQELVTESSEDL